MRKSRAVLVAGIVLLILLVLPMVASIPVTLVSYKCTGTSIGSSIDCTYKGGGCTIKAFAEDSGYCFDNRCTEDKDPISGCTVRICHKNNAHATDDCIRVPDADQVITFCPKVPECDPAAELCPCDPSIEFCPVL